MPLGKSPHQACLLEIGKGDLTLDILEAGFQAVEPISWADYIDPCRVLDVSSTIETLRPNIVWFQGDDNRGTR